MDVHLNDDRNKHPHKHTPTGIDSNVHKHAHRGGLQGRGRHASTHTHTTRAHAHQQGLRDVLVIKTSLLHLWNYRGGSVQEDMLWSPEHKLSLVPFPPSAAISHTHTHTHTHTRTHTHTHAEITNTYTLSTNHIIMMQQRFHQLSPLSSPTQDLTFGRPVN